LSAGLFHLRDIKVCLHICGCCDLSISLPVIRTIISACTHQQHMYKIIKHQPCSMLKYKRQRPAKVWSDCKLVLACRCKKQPESR